VSPIPASGGSSQTGPTTAGAAVYEIRVASHLDDHWAATLDKELAAQKLGRIREAKQRDKQRADRAKERANRSDRVSREDLKAAQDGRVGATIRFVTDDEPRERRKKPEAPKKPAKSGVLDKLGY